MVKKLSVMVGISLALLGTACTRSTSTNQPILNIVNIRNTNVSVTNIPPVDNVNMLLPTSSTTPVGTADQPQETVSVETPVQPIDDFFGRVTKKPFGIYITPATSPIQPEKFTGYHTGADAETTVDEAAKDIIVHAIADGTVVFAGHVNGYGGVMMIRHVVDGQTVTALYGHLRITSFQAKVGNNVTVGQQIAVLGTGYTSETDGERKHLHFGIIKGATVNYKGYVAAASELSAWEDPVAWLT